MQWVEFRVDVIDSESLKNHSGTADTRQPSVNKQPNTPCREYKPGEHFVGQMKCVRTVVLSWNDNGNTRRVREYG